MRTEYLDYLLEILDCESINKASQKLNFTHQHLSKILTSLEKEIGTKIFERTRTGIVLTPNGQIVIEKARIICAEAKELTTLFVPSEELARAQIQGQLPIYSSLNLNPKTLFRTTEDFRQQYPLVNIMVREKSIDEIITLVSQDPTAIGQIVMIPSILELSPMLPENVVFLPLYESIIVMLVAKNSPYANKYKTIALKTLVKHNLILYCPFNLSENITYKLLAHFIKDPPIKYAVSNLKTFYDILENGDCITVGMGKINPDDQGTELIAIPIRENIKITSGLIYHKTAEDSVLIDYFIQSYKNILHS